MDNIIHYDPRTKQEIKDLLFSYLYDPIKRKLTRELELIIQKNSVLLGAGHASFMYKGEFYSADSSRPPRVKNKLLPQLQTRMNDYLKAVNDLNINELPYVLGFIHQTLNASNNLSDYLRVFPEYLHRPIEDLIRQCPCRNKELSAEEVITLQNKNKKSIEMIKQRMVMNLLI
jgi:hypothetical protein